MSKAYIPAALRRAVATAAQDRCGYCLTQTRITGVAMQIDHIIPESRGGSSAETNLWLACATCNLCKDAKTPGIDPLTGDHAPLFHPRQQLWREHFVWSTDGIRIIGLTATGRATIHTLDMNNVRIVKSRFLRVRAGWHPLTP